MSAIVFPGGFNLPLWTAIDRGFLKSRGIELKLDYTTSSMEQLSGLIAGTWDIGLTGFDNVVAYQEGQGEAEIKVEPDLFAFMGGDNAFLRLVVQRDVKDYPELKGKTLKTGKHAGTLLVTPFELIGKSLGLHVLQSAVEVLPHYQGISGATRRRWARDNAELLVDFIRAYLEALDWLHDLRNRQAACELLAEKVPNMSLDLAAATCDILLAKQGGFDPKARLDIEGIATVLRLRNEYGRPQKQLTHLNKYHDLSYYKSALV